MSDAGSARAAGAIAGVALSAADRASIDEIREQIVARAQIRKPSGRHDPDGGQETKRARLDRNQKELETLLNKVVERPAIAQALHETGYDVGDLRSAALKGTWASKVEPALNAIQARSLGEQEDKRRETVARVAGAIDALALNRGGSRSDHWVDDLERQVRASLAGKRVSDHQVAQQIVEWFEEATSMVSRQAATAARTILVQRAFEAPRDGTRQAHHFSEPALLAALENAGIGRAAPGRDPAAEASGPTDGSPTRNRQTEIPGRHERNRIVASDGAISPQALRQVADLAQGAGETASASASARPGWLAWLRGQWPRQAENDRPIRTLPSDAIDRLPEALRRRYAVHVSDDGRKIELFEAGAKTPAIIIDGRVISTSHNEGVVVSDIVLLARDRGWQSLKISGTASFKDAVWLEASKAGLGVEHEPSSAARASLAKWAREQPVNQVQRGGESRGQQDARGRNDALSQMFAEKSAEERLADPRLRNAQLELMIGIRTAERELKRPIADLPEVAQALTAAIREQLAQGRVFDVPFVKAEVPRRVPISAPKIEADRISPPRV